MATSELAIGSVAPPPRRRLRRLRIGSISRHAVLLIFTASALFPIYFMVSSALKTNGEFAANQLGPPHHAVLSTLKADSSLVVGDNQPYSARDPVGYTVEHHAVARGLPHVAVELRQDLIADDAGARRWAEILGAALKPILARRDIYSMRRG